MIVKKLTSFARDPMTSKAILRFAPILSSKVWQDPAYWCHIIGKSFIDYISSTKRPGWKTVWPDGLIICSIFVHLQKRKGTHEQKEVCQSPRFKICQILKIPQKNNYTFWFFPKYANLVTLLEGDHEIFPESKQREYPKLCTTIILWLCRMEH